MAPQQPFLGVAAAGMPGSLTKKNYGMLGLVSPECSPISSFMREGAGSPLDRLANGKGVASYREAKETARRGRRRSSGTSSTSSFFNRVVLASQENVVVGLRTLGEDENEEFETWDFHPYVFRNISVVMFVGWLMYTVSVFNFYAQRSNPTTLMSIPRFNRIPTAQFLTSIPHILGGGAASDRLVQNALESLGFAYIQSSIRPWT